jgi:hypothetical protein
MIRVRWREVRTGPLEQSGRSVTLVAAQLTAAVTTPWFGAAASYCFPRRAELGRGNKDAVPIRDHVMVARIVGIAAVAAAGLLGRIGR